MAMNTGRELSWDEIIENESPEYVLLPEGDYDFEVVDFERARHAGSEKLPPCNKAILHIRIESEAGTAVIRHNLFLHSSTEGMICAFFTAIGQRRRGERYAMNWNAVRGARGRAKIGIRTWKNDRGEEMKSNEIRRFYDPEETMQKTPPKFQKGSF